MIQRKEINIDFLERIKITLKRKQNWIVAAFGGFMVAPIVTYSELWGDAFLTQVYGFARPTAAEITSITFVGIAIGGPAIGFISDYFKQRKAPMLYGAIGALMCICSIFFIPDLPMYALYILHILFGMFSSSMLLCFTLISEAAKPGLRATTVGLVNSVIMATGALLQKVSGMVLDYTDVDFQVGFAPLIIVCYIFALIFYYFIQETRCNFNDN